MADGWYYGRNGKQAGWVSFEQLQELANSAELLPTDLVWKEGMEEWHTANAIEGLFCQPPPMPAVPASTASEESPLGFLNSSSVQSAKATAQGVVRKVQEAARSDVSKRTQQQALTFWNKHRENPVFVGVLLLICFPVGLYLVWKHSVWTNKTKWIWTGTWAAFMALGVASNGSKNDETITVDYFPFTPGKVQTYTWDIYTTGGDCKSEEKVQHGTDQVIEVVSRTESVAARICRNGADIFRTGKTKYRLSGNYVEIGNPTGPNGAFNWRPVLKLGARKGDTWTAKSHIDLASSMGADASAFKPFDVTMQYRVESFSNDDGTQTVTVLEEWTGVGGEKGVRRYRYWFGKGIGILKEELYGGSDAGNLSDIATRLLER